MKVTCAKVELLRQNRKAGVTLFAMNKITQEMRFRQAVIEYSLKYGVTKAAIRYKTNRQYIYRWKNGMTEHCNHWQITRIVRIATRSNTRSLS